MAFTIEAALTVPLSLTLVFSSIAPLPKVERRLYLQAYASADSVRSSILDKDLYAIKSGESEYILDTCLTSPRKLQETISLGIDSVQILKRNLGH